MLISKIPMHISVNKTFYIFPAGCEASLVEVWSPHEWPGYFIFWLTRCKSHLMLPVSFIWCSVIQIVGYSLMCSCMRLVDSLQRWVSTWLYLQKSVALCRPHQHLLQAVSVRRTGSSGRGAAWLPRWGQASLRTSEVCVLRKPAKIRIKKSIQLY